MGLMRTSSTLSHAQREMDILEQTVENATISPFRKEILALVAAFGVSGQSGGSAPYVARAISDAVKDLCLQKTICPISGIDEEWMLVNYPKDEEEIYQNNRESAIFKVGKTGIPYYLDAIIFEEEDGNRFSGGKISLENGTTISSKQFIKSFPFKPKTFYINVTSERFDRDPVTKELTPNPLGDWWEHKIKDETQLIPVFDYYDRF